MQLAMLLRNQSHEPQWPEECPLSGKPNVIAIPVIVTKQSH